MKSLVHSIIKRTGFISVCENWDRYNFKALLRLVKSFVLSIWDTRKNKLYDDQDSETSGCSCSCPLTGVLTSSACVCGCMWSMASVLRQQHEYFILMQEPTKKLLHPFHLFFCFIALYHYVLTPTFIIVLSSVSLNLAILSLLSGVLCEIFCYEMETYVMLRDSKCIQ